MKYSKSQTCEGAPIMLTFLSVLAVPVDAQPEEVQKSLRRYFTGKPVEIAEILVQVYEGKHYGWIELRVAQRIITTDEVIALVKQCPECESSTRSPIARRLLNGEWAKMLRSS